MPANLVPYAAKLLSSSGFTRFRRKTHEVKRRLSGKPHTVEVFLAITDPYSFLVLQVMPALSRRYHIDIKLVIVRDKQGDMFPEPEKWQANAQLDAARLASLYDLEFPEVPPLAANKALVNNYTVQLLKACGSPTDIKECSEIFRAFWFCRHTKIDEKLDEPWLKRLMENQTHLEQTGHYFSATLYCDGEWYWGLDRLRHLEQRLNESGLSIGKEQIHFDRQFRSLNQAQRISPPQQPLTMYYSARSPYSYLGLEKAVKLCREYQCQLDIKPVLPMMMRGMQVPKTKKMYIFHDTCREARLAGIPYGFVADPLGKAVENCYALFDYATKEGKAIPYLLAFGRAVNSEGHFADTPKGMQRIVERAGLDWQQAEPLLEQNHWRQWAEENMTELSALGQWGVPCFRYQDVVVWGQDRLWVIEQAFVQPPS